MAKPLTRKILNHNILLALNNIQRHLVELRTRFTRSLIALSCAFVACYYFSNLIYDFVAKPIASKLPIDAMFITTQVTSPFMVPMQLSLLCALLITAPYLIYQAWMFISPGLHYSERKIIAPVIFSSIALFYSGIIFALRVICPVALKFFTSCAPQGVTVMLDIASYMDFIVTIAIATGVAFQIPIVTNVLIRTGIVSKQQLANKRKHVIVLAFVAGMLLAPPDVVSQIMLAVPMWLLFELGLVFSGAKCEGIRSLKITSQ